MKSCYKMKGYTLHIIPTDKFKTTSISLRLQSHLTKEETTLRTLLTFVLVSSTKNLPSTKDLASYLDENYGARLSSHITTKGQSQIINIQTSFINDLYLLDNESLLEKQLKLLSDLFYNPNAFDEAFDEVIVKLKKKELIERLQASKDDKFSYSLEKLFEYMGHNQTLGISSTGYEEDVASITAKDLYNYLQKCIQNDEKHLYVVGNVNESIVEVFDKYLRFPEHQNQYASAYVYNNEKTGVLEMIENQDITQAKLNIGYSIDTCFKDDDHYAMTVFNAVFGGISQSRLFKKVREENSLCYYVSSSYDAFNGILIVNAGIDGKDYSKAMNLIDEQLTDLQNGHITDDEINIAKMMITNSLRKTNDEAGSMIALAYNRDITGKKESSEEYIEKLLNVTKEQIIEVSKKIKKDTIFFLTGKEFYENN